MEDCCRALDRVLHAGTPGEVYNIGTGHSVTNLEIIKKLLRILAGSEDLIAFVQDRPGHDRRYALDTAKISRELGWRPAVPLEEGLARTVDWYAQHSEWVEKARSGDTQVV